jgi:probable rRNA maturation factor
MTRAARTALTVDVLVASDQWRAVGKSSSIVRRAVAQAAVALSTRGTELAIVLADDSAIRALNRDWRGIDAATNVLSFPTKNAAGRHLGDIVLAFETISREARTERKPLAHHLAHLAVHGFLHLVGYDHKRGKDALKMERAERKILHRLAIPDPYRPTARPSARNITKSPAKGAAKSFARRPGKS